MNSAQDTKQLFEHYVKLIEQKVEGVSTTRSKYSAHFTTNHPNMLPVDVYYRPEHAIVGIDIEGVDTGIWHSDEFTNLDELTNYAAQALKGNYSYNTSRFLRFDEICFPADGKWHCTRLSNEGRYSYIVPRKSIAHSRNKQAIGEGCNYKLEKIGLLRKYKPMHGPKDKIKVGSSVKLVFRPLKPGAQVNAERIWVTVTTIDQTSGEITGRIDNDPVYIDAKYGDKITFSKKNVFDIEERSTG